MDRLNSLPVFLEAYDSTQHIPRLLHLVKNVPQHQAAAAVLVRDKLLQSFNTVMYRDFLQAMFEKSIDLGAIDTQWIQATETKASKQLELLQNDCGTAQNNLQRDPIRLSFLALADFYHAKGDLSNANKMIARAKEYCSEDEHSAAVALTGTRHALCTLNYASVLHYGQFVDPVLDKLSDEYFVKFRVATALGLLDKKDYKVAANVLGNLRRGKRDATSPASHAQVLCPEGDITLIVTLCALATYDRSELGAFMRNPDIKLLLEREPVVRTMATCFYDCEYGKALAALDQLQLRIKMDMFLYPHTHNLYKLIRQSAIRQYVSPYISLQLGPMATAFSTTVAGLEKEVGELIVAGSINARIDKGASVLYANSVDPKEQAFTAAMATGDAFSECCESVIRTIALMKNHMAVRSNKRRVVPGGAPLPLHH